MNVLYNILYLSILTIRLIAGFAFFIRTLGPTMGYSLVSVFLKIYIAPGLTPIIDNSDPRWLGAWWIGWLLLATILGLTSTAMAMLPRELPRAAARRQLLWRKKELIEKKEVIQPSINGKYFTQSVWSYHHHYLIYFFLGVGVNGKY